MSQAPAIGFGCAICSDIFGVNGQRHICTIPQCGHVYHEYCVKRWFRTKIRQGMPPNCPKCRVPTTQNQVIRLFLYATTVSESNGQTDKNEDENADCHLPTSIDWDSLSLPSTQIPTHTQTNDSHAEHEQQPSSDDDNDNEL